MRAGGGVRLASSGGEGGGCSTSTSRSGPALPSFSRLGGGPGTDLEPHGLPTSSSNSDESTAPASTGSREDDDGDGAPERAKEGRWVQRPRPTKNPALTSAGECQDQRHPLGALLFHGRNDRKQRPASLDLGCPGVDRSSSTHSPGFYVSGVGVMSKGLGVSPQNRSGVLTSPGTPSYGRRGAGYQQGWSSERVPLPLNGHVRHPGGTGSKALPYSSRRALPSKWEDAERWIFSPNPHDATGRSSLPQCQRPKSKSGPLGPSGRFGAPYSSASSSTSLLDSSGVGIQAVHSPFLPGVLLPEHVYGGSSNSGDDMRGASGEDSSNGRGGRFALANGRLSAVWSTRDGHLLDSSLQSQSLPTAQEHTQDEQVTKDLATSKIPLILRKDVATQTSPDLSRSSSPNTRPSFSRSLSVQQVKEIGSCFSKLEIKDVQMDDRVTLTRWSKKHVSRGSDKNSTNIIEWKRKTMESKSSTWEVTETAKCLSRIDAEEAKMTAWESMQKAKAEAAIQKLVIKLEKKRSYSLERIFNTLRSAHRKTQVVRSTTTSNHDQQISRTVERTSHLSKNGQMSSLSGCFTCHAF